MLRQDAMPRVLVIDDDPSIRYTIDAVLTDAGFDVESCAGGREGLIAFEARGADVVLTDLSMPEMDGLGVLAGARALDPAVPVFILTAHGSERVAVTAMKAGAFEYMPKPFDPEELVLAVTRGTETHRLRRENARLLTATTVGRPIVAESPALRRVLDVVARVATKDVTVLFTGESGTGKDVLAAALYAHSRRADKAFVRLNAAAIPAELAESELFGHMKGSFTGATGNHRGYFQDAHKGTLFIDEIGDLPLGLQAKVLRALQSGEVQPVGGRPEIVDVRLIAATNKDLAAEARAGRFREDLYYRLAVVPVHIPPLRDRPEDVAPLVASFVATYAERYGMGRVDVEPALVDAFRTQPWPGNVRELENTVARLLALAPDDKLTLSLYRSFAEPKTPTRTSGDPGPSHPLRARVEAFERGILVAEFDSCSKNQSETARRLGVSRPALIEKLRKYGLLER